MAKVLVVGRGGREAALAFALARSSGVEVLALPGNDGMRAYAEVVPAAREEEALAFVQRTPVDLVVIGPEAPLAEGLADRLREAGAAVFGPSQAAARIESSKLYAKDVMRAAGVPTETARLVRDADEAARLVAESGPQAFKADGLRQGKGVAVVEDPETARHAFREIAAGGGPVYAERALSGEEVSLFGFTDGKRLVLLPAARDFKRAEAGDRGPNTGGMGAVAPVLPGETVARLAERVFRPTLGELRRRGTPFVGCLYAGLMLTAEGPVVLEYNARLGDPEAEVLLPLLTEDLYPVLRAAAEGEAEDRQLSCRGFAVGVVVAAEGYPQRPRTGVRVEGLLPVETGDSFVFWANARRDGEVAVATGGRVACVVGVGPDRDGARQACRRRLAAVSREGVYFRPDIDFPEFPESLVPLEE